MPRLNQAQVALFTMVVCLLSAVGLYWASAAPALGQDQVARRQHGSETAYTRPRHELKLGFTVAGMVADKPVKPGEHVVKGQVLIRLEDQEGQAQIEILKLQNNSTVKVDSAKAALKMAQWEFDKLELLKQKDAGAPLELERARIQLMINHLQLEQAQLEKQQLVHQLARAKATHKRYTLRAPLDGIVEQVAVSQGETVEQLKPVLVLVVIDPLWIDIFLLIEDTLTLRVGASAQVRLNLTGHDSKVVTGRIIHMGHVADEGSQRRLVRVEMPNPERLPAGVEVTVSFGDVAPMAHADQERN